MECVFGIRLRALERDRFPDAYTDIPWNQESLGDFTLFRVSTRQRRERFQ